MPILGIDNASPIWDLSQAKAEGYSFVMRYGPPNRYQASLDECAAIRRQGFGFGHIFEVEGDRALRGSAQGWSDGRRHDAWADECGAPSWVRLVYVAQDASTITRAQLRGPIADYARAFDDACSRPTMPYGAYDAIEILCGELGIAPYGWQTAGWSGLVNQVGLGSGGSFRCSDGSVRRLSKYTAMFQDVKYVLGNRADRNVVVQNVTPDWVWGGPYTGVTPKKEDDDMINWRPVICPEDPQHPENPNTGNAQWLLTWGDDGRPRRLFLGPGPGNFTPEFFWGLGWIQDVDPIEKFGEDAREFLEIPEALPEAPVVVDPVDLANALSDKLTASVVAALEDAGGPILEADADLVVSKLLARIGSLRVKLDLSD